MSVHGRLLRLSLLLVLVVSSVLGMPGRPLAAPRPGDAADARPAEGFLVPVPPPAGPPAPAGLPIVDQETPPPGHSIQDLPLPLPHECGGSTGACCAYGYVYLGDSPVAGATVRIASPRGFTETVTAPGEYSPYPYYEVDLSESPLSATEGTVITITAAYSGAVVTRTWTVVADGQQVDLALATVPQPRLTNWVYDPDRQRFVLFGGEGLGGRFDDTWEYDGAHWVRVDTANAPAPRIGFGLAYDGARQRVVLFGGTPAAMEVLSDTWEYDGVNWTLVSTANAPSPRSDIGMTYDTARQRVMLFGGTNRPGSSEQVFHDTWVYNGVNWANLIFLGDPPGRILEWAMTYDTQRQRVLFHGDWDGGGCDNATWEYDGSGWTQVATGPARYGQALAYDSDRGRFLMYDGSDCTQSAFDTWEYDPLLAQWTEISTTAPTVRAVPLVYDPVGHRFLAFGGTDDRRLRGQVWQYDPLTQRWQVIVPLPDVTPAWARRDVVGAPLAQVDFAFDYDPDRGRLVLFGGTGGPPPGECSGETWELAGLTWTQVLTGGPSARSEAGLAYDAAQQRFLLFGGYVGCDPAGASGETWQYDPFSRTWTPLFPPHSPSPRGGQQMAYDAGRGRLVLFGGWDGSAYLGDTWEFDGTDWTPISPPHAPPARAGGRMVYAADRGTLVLVGGGSTLGDLDDAWEYDGGDWVELAPPPAGAPAGLGLAYDPLRRRLVLYGGAAAGTWEYDGRAWQPIAVLDAPVGRLFPAMVYDAACRQTLLYGGVDGTTFYTDTWAYLPGSSPQAALAALPPTGTVPLAVQFIDRSSGNTSWQWSFGDGGVSGARYPFYTYAHTGTYTVSLAVGGPAGTDVVTRSHYITVTPTGLPVAGILTLWPNPAMQGVDVVYFEGYGMDTDDKNCCIVAGRVWSSLDGLLLSTTMASHVTMTTPAISLSVGLHWITFTVVDNDGEVSPPDTLPLRVVPYAAAQVRTLILTNEQRLAALYGAERAAAVIGRLSALAADARTSGTVIRVEEDPAVAMAYAAWDTDPTSTAAANAVTAAIKAVVDEVWDSQPLLSYLVIAGDDRVIPFHRVPDQTHYRESRYGLVPVTTTVGAALRDDMTLTDDYYADRVPTVPSTPGWDGHDLYLPDLGVGRLVETPEEIMAQVEAFLTAPGQALSDTVVTGYGIIEDGAEAICERLGWDGITTTCTLIGPGWGRDTWISQTLSTPRDLVSFNSHARHDRVGTATSSERVYAADIASAGAGLTGTLFYGPGCHAGLNVVTSTVGPLDIPQALARRQALLVGNTGYGWAGLYTVALSERLLLEFTDYLVRMRSTPVGGALASAKRSYYLTEPTFDFYDEKVLLESTLYGLPMAVYTSPAGMRRPTGRPGMVEQGEPAFLEDGLIVTTMTYGLMPLAEHVTTTGRYYSFAGQTSFGHREPIQPMCIDDNPIRFSSTHGVVLQSAAYSDIAGFDPVIAPAITETAALTEPVLPGPGWFPARLVRFNRLDAGSRLLLLLGQYNPAGEVERLYRRLSVEIYDHPTATDWLAPEVIGVASTVGGGSALARVRAADPSGLAAVVVAYTAGGGTWESVALVKSGGVWEGAFPAPPGTAFFVQVVDGAGNVAVADNEGQYYRPGEGTWWVYLPVVLRP